MVLTDGVIKREIDQGNIVLQGFVEQNLGPNSYDMTLAPTCKIYHADAIIQPSMEYQEKRKLYVPAYDNLHDSDKGFKRPGQDWFLDAKSPNPVYEFEIPEEGFILQPNHLYLYSCNETLGVKGDICATVMGKSSLGRLGLDIHVCAGFVDSGFVGSLVLEMRTIYPLKIYPNMKICQVKFERTEGVAQIHYGEKKDSKYQNQTGVQESLYHQNFGDTDQV